LTEKVWDIALKRVQELFDAQEKGLIKKGSDMYPENANPTTLQDVLNNIDQKFIVQANVISVGNTQYTPQNGKAYQLVVLHDGQQQKKVRIYQGTGQPMTERLVGLSEAFQLSSYSPPRGVFISGFWQAPLDAGQVQQVVRQAQQPSSQQPAQRVGGHPVVNKPQIPPAAQKAIDGHLTDKERENLKTVRTAIMTAKDLVIANPSWDIFITADEIVEYIQTGRHPAQREETQEIPETEEPPF